MGRCHWIIGTFALGAAFAFALPGGRPQAASVPGETLPDEGNQHVPDSTSPQYRTDPPTSGPHYDDPAPPGFYDSPPRPGAVVHSLEHGNIVIYFDPKRVPAKQVEELKQLAAKYQGFWDGVLVIARPDPKFPVIVTAWRHWLRLPKHDQEAIGAFIEAYRGRGPERQVR